MLSHTLEMAGILMYRGKQMKNNIVAVLMIAALCAPGTRAFAVPAQEPFAASVGSVLAQANSSTEKHRLKARREHVGGGITRVTDLYTNGVGPITRCMGEMNVPSFYGSVASLAILGMRIQQGRYAGASGDQEISEQLHPAAGRLLELAKRNCLTFSDPKARAAWVVTLESLTQE